MAVAEQQSKPNSIALLTESPYSSGLQLLEGRYIDLCTMLTMMPTRPQKVKVVELVFCFLDVSYMYLFDQFRYFNTS